MAPQSKPNLTREQLRELIGDLVDGSFEQAGTRVLQNGKAKEIAAKFNITMKRVRELWRRAKKTRQETGSYTISPLKKGRSGRPLVYDREAIKEAVAVIPRELRGTVRGLAGGLGISPYLAWELIRVEKIVLPHTSAIKPHLTEENKFMRLLYAANRVEKKGDGTHVFTIGDDEVHVDEKWFFISKETNKVYLTEKELEEDAPERTCRHKSHILKVMFLCAVARPRFDEEGNCTFDGKLGIWPFVEKVPAQRSSVNRARGTIETKTVKVTKTVYKDYMINKVLPAIVEKWPRERGQSVVVGIQQDNPNTHMKTDDVDWQQTCEQYRFFSFRLREQPANSPDTNILDLGFFRALEALAWKYRCAKNIDELIANVKKAYSDYDPVKLNHIWISHQAVCDEILKHNGDNHFKLPHIGKGSLERAGQLPSQLPVSDDAITGWSVVNTD